MNKMNKMELYNEWQRLSKLAKEAHDSFDKAHRKWIKSDMSTENETHKKNEAKQHLIKIRSEAGEIYEKYEAA